LIAIMRSVIGEYNLLVLPSFLEGIGSFPILPADKDWWNNEFSGIVIALAMSKVGPR
jgi:hypothetical protein